jgi:hypothetical protein
LLIALLCISALSPLAYGATFSSHTQETKPQEQKEKKSYDVYVGQYEVAKDFILTITNEDGKLMVQPTGESKAEFKPEETVETFFSQEVNARLKFATNDKNEVTGVLVSIGGKDFWAKKIK